MVASRVTYAGSSVCSLMHDVVVVWVSSDSCRSSQIVYFKNDYFFKALKKVTKKKFCQGESIFCFGLIEGGIREEFRVINLDV